MFKITKEMLQAWKKCNDAIVISLYQDDEFSGVSVEIKISRKVKGYDETLDFKAKSNFAGDLLVTGYCKATFVELFAYSSNWSVLQMIVKEGDEMFFQVYDNYNGYMEKAEVQHAGIKYKGLHQDTLVVSVYRPLKNGTMKKIIDGFHLCVDAPCPDNSARALRKTNCA